MANNDFVVKNGLIVNTNLIWANTGKVGINNSTPDAALTVTGDANISGNVTIQSNTTISGRLDINNTAYIDTRLYVGNTTTMVTLTNPIIQAVDNFNGFVQVSSQNLSQEDDACADLLIYADNTNGLTYFNDVGLNNSRFDGRIHRVSANTLADNLTLGETVFQSNGSANVAVGVLLNVTVINSTSRSVAVAVANGKSFVNTGGVNLSLRGVSSSVNTSILVAVPFGTVSSYSRRNYPFTIGVRTDGYLYQANAALTLGTTEGGIRSFYQSNLATSITFSSGANTVTCTSTSLLYPELIIEGTGIPSNTRIVSVTNSTSFKINKSTTAANSGSYTFTDPAYDLAGNPIIFHTNGMLAENEIARFSGNGNLTLGTNTVSRESKLTVDGNANIVGNVAIGGNLISTGAANLQSTLRVGATTNLVGAATLSNTLSVTGNVTFSNTLTIPASGITIGTATINSTTYTGTVANTTSLNGQPASYYTNATNINTGTLSNSRLPAVATTITQVGTLSGLTVSGNTTLPGVAFTTNATSNLVSISAANLSVDSGTLFVDSVNNRVGVNNSTPDAALTVTGSANVSGNLRIQGDLLVDGATVSVGETVSQGDFVPSTNSFNLGNSTSRWTLYGVGVETSGAVNVGVTATNVVVNTTTIAFSNSTVVGTINALSYTGTAANATLFNNQSASYYANANNLSTGTVAPARLPQANATTNGAVLILDSVTNTSIAIYAAAPNSVKTAYDAAISANTRAASAQSAAVSAYTNAVTYTDSAVATAYTNAISYSGNAAAAYANAIAYSGNAAAAYTNAITFSANATNLTNGTIPYARIPANIINTTAAFTRTGITTFNASVILGSSGLSANGGFGTSGQALYTNGTATYWADAGGVSSVGTGNGLTGGPIIDFGTISVVQGTGVVVNTSGVHVNAAYIGTISSNNAATVGGNSAATLRAFSTQEADTSYTNAIAFSANATNLTNGTIPYARIPANIVNTTAAFTRTGITTFSANVILGSSGLSANGGFGSTGQVLYSNGTAAYWNAVTSGVTQIIASSGLSGGTITGTGTIAVIANNGIISNTTGVYVRANTGLVANATGLYVNASYIGSISSGSTTNILGGAVGDLVYQTGAGTTGFIGGSQFGKVLKSNSSSTAPFYDRIANPAEWSDSTGANNSVAGDGSDWTGTANWVDFTIGSWATKVHIVMYNVSLAASGASFQVRLGDSGGIESTSYTSAYGPSGDTSTIGMLLYTPVSSGETLYGEVTLLRNINDYSWIGSGNAILNGNKLVYYCGRKATSAATTTVRLVHTNNSTATFTATRIGVWYE